MLRIKKRIPEALTKWEKENNVYGYQWGYETLKGKDGVEIITDSYRKYAMSRYDGLIEIPDEIKALFKTSACKGNSIPKLEEPKEEPKKGKGK